MKKLIIFLLILIPSTLFAQTVYFGNISKKTSVGLGIEGNNVILSVMELNKSKKFDDFNIRFFDMDGQLISLEMVEDTIYHLDLEKTFAHQKDYKLDLRNYNRLKLNLNSQSYVIIDGVEYNGAAFVGVLRSLEQEQSMFNRGMLPNISKISIYSWNRNIQMMRFKHPQSKGFRYIRKGM